MGRTPLQDGPKASPSPSKAAACSAIRATFPGGSHCPSHLHGGGGVLGAL